MDTITSKVFMVRPSNFGFNAETAQNNAFQDNSGSLTKSEINSEAVKEFDNLVSKLKIHGIEVIVYEDSAKPLKTDAVFPNNWITTHEEGIIITYPMYSNNRRLERSSVIIEDLKHKFGYDRHYFFEHYETEDKFLEGTGSMILDRENKIIYACLSERTNIEVLEKFSVLMSYKKIYFHSNDDKGKAIYHTNVMMALAEEFCIICMESIASEVEKSEIEQQLKLNNKEIIEISQDQVNHFAGNMLQLKNTKGERFLIMSEQAYHSLHEDQIAKIQSYCRILHSPLNVIEKYGGGSARCMIAEIFQ